MQTELNLIFNSANLHLVILHPYFCKFMICHIIIQYRWHW